MLSFVQEITLVVDGTYSTVATIALVVYEYLITIQLEREVVWKRPWTATSVLLLSTRWAMLLSAIFTLIPHSPQTCEPLLVLSETLFLLGIAQTALFSALRVFAVWDQSYILAALVLVLELVPFGTNLFNDVVYIYYNQTVGGSSSCTTIFPYPQHVRTMLVCWTRSSAVAGDTLVLVLTWARTFKNWYDGRKLNMDLSVSAHLLRDGTIYFLCLLIVNITQLIASVHWRDNIGTSIVGPFLLVLPPILICRFMINLRSLGSTEPARERSEATSRSYFSAVGFRVPETVLGNIGEALQHDRLSSGSTSSEVLETLAAEEDGMKLNPMDGGEPAESADMRP